jgi:hypothetical protein
MSVNRLYHTFCSSGRASQARPGSFWSESDHFAISGRGASSREKVGQSSSLGRWLFRVVCHIDGVGAPEGFAGCEAPTARRCPVVRHLRSEMVMHGCGESHTIAVGMRCCGKPMRRETMPPIKVTRDRVRGVWCQGDHPIDGRLLSVDGFSRSQSLAGENPVVAAAERRERRTGK